MALIIGQLRPDATTGEEEVLNRLRELPEGYIVWPELAVYDAYPDFIILVPHHGLAILEVKDWVEIATANPYNFTILTRSGEERQESNPVRAVREKAIAVSRKLTGVPGLIHRGGPHDGKLRVGYAYAVLFPRLNDLFIWQLGEIFDDNRCVISKDRLQQTPPAALLDGLNWRFEADLSPGDLDLIRGTIYPELTVTVQEQTVGIMDLRQEQIAKEGLHERRIVAEEDELPEHGRRVADNMVIRLVRGVVGSGKTLVLTRRARYLAELHPDWNILVVSFNKALAYDLQNKLADCGECVTAVHFHQLCADLLKDTGDWGSGPVDDRQGAIRHLRQNISAPGRFEVDFLDEEIRWMKDSGIRQLDRYLEEPRIGRGRPLSQADRQEVFAVYDQYQQTLDRRHRFDWEDVPIKVSDAIELGIFEGGRFDAIMVDEAQDFAPTWFHALRLLLKPGGMMFLAADGVQRIYRKHSWKSLGLNVVGRTRVLPYCYRNTYEIARSALELVQQNQSLVEALQHEGEDLLRPELDPLWMRRGDPPTLHRFPDKNKENTWLANRLKELRDCGYNLSDIALFHRYQSGVEAYAGALRSAGLPVRELRSDAPVTSEGITVGTMHAAKGLEFRVVFVLQLQTLFDRGRARTSADDRRSFTAEETRLLYVAVTRARERVYLTFQGALPGELMPFGRFVQQMKTAGHAQG
jgi:hypothetical protein